MGKMKGKNLKGKRPFTSKAKSKGKKGKPAPVYAGRRKLEDEEDLEDEDLDEALHVHVPSVGAKAASSNDEDEGYSAKKITQKKHKHKDELEGLKEKDPEFFKFLQQNDAGLLEFDEEDSDEEDMFEPDEDAEFSDSDGGDEEDGSGRKHKKPKKVVEVTSELLEKMMKKLKHGDSLNNLKRILSIFRAACIPLKDDDETDMAAGGFLIASAEVYEEAMTTILDSAHSAFSLLLGLPPRPSLEDSEAIGQHPRWKKLQLQVLSFYKSVLHTLANLADASKQGAVTVYIVSALEPYIPLLAPLPRLAKGVLKVLLSIWSHGSTQGEDIDVRGHAFLRIRQMALVLPGALTEECFRSIYLTYARYCKTFNEQNRNTVFYMAQCITELYKTNPEQAYQQAFLYIRQLALYLRLAAVKKEDESIRQVTSWQFLNCMQLWTRVLCTLPGKDDLGPLVYPLVQVMQGVMLVAQSPSFIPLRCHLINCMQQVAAYAQVFIPTASKVLEILHSADLLSKPAPSTDTAPKMNFMIKFSADSLHKPSVKDAIVQRVVTLLRQDAECYRFHVGLPEYLFITLRKLRKFNKKCRNSRWKDLIRALINQLDQYSNFVISQRSQLRKAVVEIVEFEPLLSAGLPTAAARLTTLMSSNNHTDSASEIIIPSSRIKIAPIVTDEGIHEEDGEDDEDVEVAEKKKNKSDKDKKKKKRKEFDDFPEVEHSVDAEDKLTAFDWSDDDDDA